MIRHVAKIWVALFLAGVVLAAAGCSSMNKIDTSTAQGSYRLATTFEEDERYEEALAEYRRLKNQFPYSQYATKAELKIADILYKRETYVEAEGAYRLFKEFHPNHAKVDYATFRLAMSVYKQLPSTIDRDLTLADRAIQYFNEVIRSYGNSEYREKAEKYKNKARKMLAEKEFYIGNFYFIREHFDSALGRFEDILKDYPGLGLNAKTLYKAAVSAHKVDNQNKAKRYYRRLISSHKKSKFAERAKQELSDEL